MKADAVIIGGGPAGAACAIALAKGGVKCVLFERNLSPPCKVGEIVDSEVQVPLQELGLWGRFASRNYLRSAGTISSWGSDAEERSAAIDPYGGGILVDRADLEAVLLAAAEEAGVEVITGAHVQAASRTRGKWHVVVRYTNLSHSVVTPLLIEANGRGRAIVGSSERTRVDSLTALLAYPVSGDETRDLRLWLEATPNGWWYGTALPNAKSIFAFLTDVDLLPAGRDAREKFFYRQVQESSLIKTQFRYCRSAGQVLVAPAMSTIRQTLSGEGWVAIGDAAATYDPLMGLGVAVAVSKGLAFARLLLCEPVAVAIKRYAQAERVAFANYLRRRRSIYSQEQRWLSKPFWHRRIAAN